MNSISSNKFILAVLLAVVLGIVFGLVMPGLMLAMSFVGELFVNILQIIFIPLVASAIITGVSAFANSRKTIRAALAALFLFLGTTVAAVFVGLVLVLVFKPGVGANIGAAFIPDEIASSPLSQSLDFLTELVPSNIVSSVMQGKFLGWMIMLTIAAAILGSLGQKAKAVTDFFETVYAVIQKVLEKLNYIVPVGIFFVVATAIAHNGDSLGSLTGSLGKLTLVLFFGFFIHAFVTMPLLLKFLAHRSPAQYFLNVIPALKTALATGSPTAALPVTYENSVERNNLDKRIAALVLPVGSSLNVNGRALYVTVCALFIDQAFALNLGIGGILYVALASIFFSIGTAVVPFAAMLSLVAVFDSTGFSSVAYTGIGLVFVLDWFWARIFAALDVWSDTAVAAVVENSIALDVARPARTERPPEQRYERGGPRRDYRDRRPPRDFRGREPRPERPARPFSPPEREPVRPARESLPERAAPPQAVRKDKAPSPFELKVEKEFDIELAKTAEPAAEKPVFIKKERAIPDRRDRRKVREQKRYPRGHEASESEIAEKRRETKQAEAAPKEEPMPVARTVVPPPLIRDIEKSRETEAAPVEEKQSPPVVKNKPESAGEETQTSLYFGRTPQRKTARPKSDEPPKPVEDAEIYSKEKQAFGRGLRKKKST